MNQSFDFDFDFSPPIRIAGQNKSDYLGPFSTSLKWVKTSQNKILYLYFKNFGLYLFVKKFKK